MKNPYHVVQIGTREDGVKIYGVEYKDYPHVGIPDSWGHKGTCVKIHGGIVGNVI